VHLFFILKPRYYPRIAIRGVTDLDYYQGVVSEYLRANRQTFINPEFLLQIEPVSQSSIRGRYWYIDILAVNFAEQSIYLCEVTYSKGMRALTKKLSEFALNWNDIKRVVHRDSGVPESWSLGVWCFVREENIQTLLQAKPLLLPHLQITPLEDTQPWKFCTWNRI
jgi:hypothetical protein